MNDARMRRNKSADKDFSLHYAFLAVVFFDFENTLEWLTGPQYRQISFCDRM